MAIAGSLDTSRFFFRLFFLGVAVGTLRLQPANSFASRSTVLTQRQYFSKTIDILSRRTNDQQLLVIPPLLPLSASTQEDLEQQQNESPSPPPTRSKPHRRGRSPVSLYTSYASRLWSETNVEARRRISSDRTSILIHQLQSMLKEDDNLPTVSATTKIARENIMRACDEYLAAIQPPILAKVDDVKTPSELAKPLLAAAGGEIGEMQEVKVLSNGARPPSSEAKHADNDDDSLLTNVGSVSKAMVVVSNPPQDVAFTSSPTTAVATTKPKKQRRSITFGAAMGLLVACWVFSGSYIFTALFTLMTVLGQLEYYRMVINTGVYPARRISIVGACSMFLTALFTPSLHQICLPLFGLYSMVWFLTMKRSVTTIPEIATTFTGMFYLGYVPSFWVRIRLINTPAITKALKSTAKVAIVATTTDDPPRELTRLAPLVAPILEWVQCKSRRWFPNLVQAVHLPITTGAIFIFWTWLALAFSDVAAYFVGKNLGKTKLGVIAPAAGATSPNKTVEGVVGGCTVCALLSILGAWVQKWPYPILTGGIHGLLLGLIGLIGDLTASMLKRDAGLKDFGDLIPEHGGIMDRVDSFVWAAPYSWLICAYVIPALKQHFR